MKITIAMICVSQTVYYEVKWRAKWWHLARQSVWFLTEELARGFVKRLQDFYQREGSS